MEKKIRKSKKSVTKIIAVVLATVIATLSFATVISPLAESENRIASAKKLGNSLSAMCEKYDCESTSDSTDYIPERLIVKTSDELDTFGAVDFVRGGGMYFLQYADADSASRALEQYKAQGLTAEYDLIRESCAVSVSSNYNSYWNYELVETEQMLDYFNLKTNSKIVVGVADSGVDYNHSWFKGSRINRTNYNISGTGNEDDEMDNNAYTYHGTGVAGVIANCTPNNVKLACYKVSNNQAKTTSSKLEAFYYYLTQLKDSERPDILNMSYGGVSFSQLEKDLLEELYNDGVVLVAAAGNNNNTKENYPASFDFVISVSASGKDNSESGTFISRKAKTSSYGWNVDITAPGENILTALADPTVSGSTSEAIVSGTSFSAPMVAAGCAIILMQNNKLTPEQVKARLLEGATPIDNPKNLTFAGAGMLNLYNLIDARRVEDVEFNISGGFFEDDELTLEMTCPNNYSEIYYTTDYTFPTKENGTLYTEPLTITEDTRVIAVALPKINTRVHSYYKSESYVFIKNAPDSDFIITDEGVITDYTGADTAIVIPDTINGITTVSIGPNAFTRGNYRRAGYSDYISHTGCVQYVRLPDSVVDLDNRYYNSGAFYNSELRYIKGDGVSIAHGFSSCSYLYEVDMPNVTEVKSYAFYLCRSLKNINFNDSVESIGAESFYGAAIVDADFPNATYVGGYAFGCSDIERASLPKITELLSGMFLECEKLIQLELPPITSIGKECFYNCKGLTEPISFDSVTSIDDNAFDSAYFDTIDLPSCTEIGTAAFNNCKARIINIPRVEILKSQCFYNCTELEQVDLQSVTGYDNLSSGKVHFYNCWKLKYLVMPNARFAPNIKFSLVSVPDNTVSELEYMYLPKVESFSNWWGANMNLDLCTRLRFIFVPTLNYNVFINLSKSNPETVLYISDKLNLVVEMSSNIIGNFCIVAPESSGAEEFARANEHRYIQSETLSFSRLENNEYIYSNGTDSVSLPAYLVKMMWENTVINNRLGDETYTFLLDFNNDGYVNAKDYAIMNR